MTQKISINITKKGKTIDVFREDNFLFQHEIGTENDLLECYTDQYEWYKKYYYINENKMNKKDHLIKVDVTADVLTSLSTFNFLNEDSRDKYFELRDIKDIELKNSLNRGYNIFSQIYYTYGNLIPWASKSNYGGRPYSIIGNISTKMSCTPDIFSRKLFKINEAFNNNIINEENEDEYKELFFNGKDQNLKNLNRWIYFDWIKDNKKFNDFINENYLQDFLKNNTIITFGENEGVCNFMDIDPDKLNEIIQTCIKLIIQRGYRLQFGIKENFSKEDEDNLKPIFRYFKLDERLA